MDVLTTPTGLTQPGEVSTNFFSDFDQHLLVVPGTPEKETERSLLLFYFL